MLGTVRRLAVMSSPTRPSPRVTQRVSTPSSYTSAVLAPSNLGSTIPLEVPVLELEEAADLLLELAHLVLGEEALDREHGDLVLDALQALALGDRGPDALGRAVGADQLGVLFLERLQLAEQRVVLGVADRRLGLDVVAEVVARDLLAQLGRPRALCRRGRHARSVPSGSRSLGRKALGKSSPRPASARGPSMPWVIRCRSGANS